MQMRNGELKIDDITYHRNGVAGDGFYVVLFRSKDAGDPVRNLVATVFNWSHLGPIQTAVLEPADLTSKWRGDYYHRRLVDAIFDQQFAQFGAVSACGEDAERESESETNKRKALKGA